MDDLEWGYCPVCHGKLEVVVLPQTIYHSCACGYAREVGKTEEPWRR